VKLIFSFFQGGTGPYSYDWNPYIWDGMNVLNGSIILNQTLGGTPPYFYNWSTGSQSSEGIENLLPGAYFLTITDAHDCAQVFAFEVDLWWPIKTRAWMRELTSIPIPPKRLLRSSSPHSAVDDGSSTTHKGNC
jgi:hypothetical protein